MTALLPILERQADGRPDQVTDPVGAPFTETDLLAELDEQASACAALALVALGRGLAATPFELSQLVLDSLWLLTGSGVDAIRAAMVEDAVVVHAGGGSPGRLRRADNWLVLFGTMGAIAGLAKLLAAERGGPASAYVRLAFDVPPAGDEVRPAPRSSLGRGEGRAADRSADRSTGRSSAHPAGTGAPSGSLALVERWAAERPSRHNPDVVDPHDVQIDVRQRGKSITIVERWRRLDSPSDGNTWIETRVAQLRWVAASNGWSLHYADRADRWHRCGDPLTPDLAVLLATLDDDPDHVFWG